MISETANAQHSKLEVRFAGGPNRSILFGNEVVNSSNPLYGTTGEFSFEYHFNRFISVIPGISINEKGSIDPTMFSDTIGNPLMSADIITKLKYVNVPLLIRVSFGRSFKFYFNTGPYIGLLKNAKIVTPSYGSIAATETNIDSTLKSQEWGISFGLGISFPISKRIHIGVELRNDAGLQNISKLPFADGGDLKTNETSALFTVSYILFKSHKKEKDKDDEKKKD